LSFPSVDLPKEGNEEVEGLSGSYPGDLQLQIIVDSCPRPAADDRIAFTVDGREPFNDKYPRRSPDSSGSPPRPGWTLRVPAGLGEAAYASIMKALGEPS
jgi:hypothetical protein